MRRVLPAALSAEFVPPRDVVRAQADDVVRLAGGALPDGAVERLNAALGPAAGEGWQWVDEQGPTAAGEPYPP